MASHNRGPGEKACVSLVPIFNHLEEKQMQEVMKVVQKKHLNDQEIMYHAGDTSDSLYVIHKGRVKVYQLSESGDEQLVRILNPGDFTGELALFQEGEHETFAEGLMESEICFIEREDLQRLLDQYPTISFHMLTELSNRLNQAEKQTMSVSTKRVEERIADFLVESIENNATADNLVTLPVSKKDIASYLGTTPETLSRKLTEFEKAGYIKQKGQRDIEIIDVDGLLLS